MFNYGYFDLPNPPKIVKIRTLTVHDLQKMVRKCEIQFFFYDNKKIPQSTSTLAAAAGTAWLVVAADKNKNKFLSVQTNETRKTLHPIHLKKK